MLLQGIHPVGVLGLDGVGAQVRAGDDFLRQVGELPFQAAGQHGKAHDLDEADVFLLDMVLVRVGVEDSQGVLLGGDVAAQHQVQLVEVPPAAGNGGDGVVGLAVGECENGAAFVGIVPPGVQDFLGQLRKALGVLSVQADDAHGPLDQARLNVLVAPESDGGFHGGGLHGEGVVAALEVLVAQNGAADDGQVCVGADEVVGKQGYEVQQLFKGGAVDFHGHVLAVEDDAVLVIVDIGGVLQIPLGPGDGDGDDAVVGPGGVVHAAGVALVFPAQLAFGVAGLGGVLGGGDGLGVLFGLAQVDGDVHLAVFAVVFPAHVLGDAVASDVIGVAAQPVVPVGGLPGGRRIFPGKRG